MRNLTLARINAAVAGVDFKVGKKVRFEVPVHINGEGAVELGDHVVVGTPLAIRLGSGEVMLHVRGKEAAIRIGSGTETNNNVAIYATEGVEIGRDCLIAELVSIYDSDFHELDPQLRRTSPGPSAAVRIGDRVWLGSRVMVLKGVEIGNDSVIAAGAIVTTSIPTGVLAGGVPAKVIRPLVKDKREAMSEGLLKPVA